MTIVEDLHRLTWQRMLRRLRTIRVGEHFAPKPVDFDATGMAANSHIFRLLDSSKPCMIARFGNNELRTVENFLSIQEKDPWARKLKRYLRGEGGPWWWDERTAREMTRGAGFFPATPANLARFARLSLDDCAQIDVLGSWLLAESRLGDRLHAIRVPIGDLEPYFHDQPWSQVLAGKRVLVVHPFERSIRSQYAKRDRLFKNPAVLPEFEIQTYASVQSIGGVSSRFQDWFEALEHMQHEISNLSFDVAIIGAGAYGMPLAAFIKRDLSKQAVHLGGVTQILFGIKGRRWDKRSTYSQALYNEHWVRPGADETPEAAKRVEGGCYW